MNVEAAMDYDPPSPQSQRQVWLAVLLAVVVTGSFLAFLVTITGGLFIVVLAAAAGIALFGYMHYLLWGRSLSEQVAGERAEEEARAEADDGSFEEHPGPRHY
jgi:hypothetical protein